MNGNIINIERFAIHDGPGIRSVVFLKGCPLHCLWCQNPEGIKNEINLWYFEKKCIRCHKCINSCKNKALTIGKKDEPHILINRINAKKEVIVSVYVQQVPWNLMESICLQKKL